MLPDGALLSLCVYEEPLDALALDRDLRALAGVDRDLVPARAAIERADDMPNRTASANGIRLIASRRLASRPIRWAKYTRSKNRSGR
jgi:hypothetical protein